MSEEINNDSAATQGDTNAPQTTPAATPDSQSTNDSALMGGAPGATPSADDSLMGGEPDTGKPAEGEEPEAPVVPETYEAFDVSSGEDIGYAFTDEQHAAFSEVAKELGLTQEQAQNLVEYDIKRQGADAEANKAQAAKEKADAEADKLANIEASRKEYGDNYADAWAKAKSVYANDKIVPPELRQIFNEAGFNNNQHLFRLLVNIGEKISEDTFDSGEKGKTSANLDSYSSLLPQPNLDERGVKR